MPRRLGQHFLINKKVVARILQALELSPQDSLLEIGPGRGALTWPLIRRAKKLLLVEKDPDLAEGVRNNLPADPGVVVWNQDFLATSREQIVSFLGDSFKVVSNLPYQAATAILIKILTEIKPGSPMVLMFQKEVADRLLASPHTKDYGSLTIFTQLFARMRSVMEVPPLAFRPPPRVYSTVLKFRFHPEPLIPENSLKEFEGLLKCGFGHRRKMLRQNLRAYYQGETAAQIEGRLQTVQASPQARAEELSVQQWLDLFHSKK